MVVWFSGFSSLRITLMIHDLSSGLSMVALAWCHGPNWGNPRWENVDGTDIWIDMFILVIRLSTVQQLAFFSGLTVSPVVVDVFNRWLLWLASPFRSLLIAWQPRQRRFVQFFSRDRPLSAAHERKGNRHVLSPAGVVFLVFGEVYILCTKINRHWQLYSLFGRTDHGLLESKSWTSLGTGTESHACFLVDHHQ